jgi:hypothetical protein
MDAATERDLAARRKERSEEQDAEQSRALRRRREAAQQLFDIFAALHEPGSVDPQLADLVWAWVLDYPLDKPGGLPRMLREFQVWYHERQRNDETFHV